MKKMLFSFMAFLILILGSCQESAYVEDIQETPSKEQLIYSANKVDDGIVARLQAYNDSLINSSASIILGGNSNSKKNKNLDVALADAAGFWEGAGIGASLTGNPYGALILGVLFGAYTSYQASDSHTLNLAEAYNNSLSAYIYMKESSINISDYYPKKIKLALPIGKSELLISGAQHNILVDNIQNTRFSTTTLKEAFNSGLISKEEMRVLGHSDTKNLFRSLKNWEPSFDTEGTSNSIVNLYQQAIQNSANSYSDVESISNRYISEIFSDSDLQSTQKDKITYSISVLVSSVEYWSVFDSE